MSDFFRNARVVEQRHQSGLILGSRVAFTLDVSRFARSIEKIVRGLFYCKSDDTLASGYKVFVVTSNEFWRDRGFQNILADMSPARGCGDDVFLMRCVRDRSDPNVTAWLFLFYGAVAAFAWTEADAQASKPALATVNSRDP
jgi:hypothetical protein